MHNRNMLLFIAFAVFFTLSTISIASAQVDPYRLKAVCTTTQSNLACNANAIFNCQVDINVQNAIVNSVDMTIDGRVQGAQCIGCSTAADTQNATWRVTLPNLGYDENIRLDAVTVRSSGGQGVPTTCSASQTFGEQTTGCDITFGQRSISNACVCEYTETVSSADVNNRVTITRTPGPGCFDQTPISYQDFGDHCNPQWTLQESACVDGETEKLYVSLNPSCCVATSGAAGNRDFNHMTGSDCTPPIDQGQKVSCDINPRVSMAENHIHDNVFERSELFSFSNNRNFLQQIPNVGAFEPLQWDIGNNGYVDIIAFSPNSVRVYQSNTLQQRSSITLPGEITGQPAFAGVFATSTEGQKGIDFSVFETTEEILNGEEFPLLVVPVDLGVGGYEVRVYEFLNNGNLNLLHSRNIQEGKVSGVTCIGYQCYFMAGDGYVYRYDAGQNIIFSPTQVNVFWDGQEFSQVSSQYKSFEGYTPIVYDMRTPQTSQMPALCSGILDSSPQCKQAVLEFAIESFYNIYGPPTAGGSRFLGLKNFFRSGSSWSYTYTTPVDGADASNSLFLVWVMRDDKAQSADVHDNLHVVVTSHIGNQVYNVYKVKPSQLALTSEQFTNPNLVGPPSSAAIDLDITGSPARLGNSLYIPMEERVTSNGVDVLSLSVVQFPLSNIDSIPALDVFPEYFATNFWIGEESAEGGEGISNIAITYDRSQLTQVVARPVVKISTRSQAFATSIGSDVSELTELYSGSFNYVVNAGPRVGVSNDDGNLVLSLTNSNTIQLLDLNLDSTIAQFNTGGAVRNIAMNSKLGSSDGFIAYSITLPAFVQAVLSRVFRVQDISNPFADSYVALQREGPGTSQERASIYSFEEDNSIILDASWSDIYVVDPFVSTDSIGSRLFNDPPVSHTRANVFVYTGTLHSECIKLYNDFISACDYSWFEILPSRMLNAGSFNYDSNSPAYIDVNGRKNTITGVNPLQVQQSAGACPDNFYAIMYNSDSYIQGFTSRPGQLSSFRILDYVYCDFTNPNQPNVNVIEDDFIGFLDSSSTSGAIKSGFPSIRLHEHNSSYSGDNNFTMTITPICASHLGDCDPIRVKTFEVDSSRSITSPIIASTEVFEITTGMIKSNVVAKSFEPISKISAGFTTSRNFASVLAPEGIYSTRLQDGFRSFDFGTGSQFVYATDLNGLNTVDLVSLGTQSLQTWVSQPEVRPIIEGPTSILNHRCTSIGLGRVSVGAFVQVPELTDLYESYSVCILPGDGSGFQCTSDWRGELQHTYRQSGTYNLQLQVQGFQGSQVTTDSVMCQFDVTIPQSLQTQRTACSLGTDGEFNYVQPINSRGWTIQSGQSTLSPSSGRLNVPQGTIASYRLNDCDFAFMSFEIKLAPTSGRILIDSAEGESFGVVFDGVTSQSGAQRSIRSATTGAALAPFPVISGDSIVILEVDYDNQLLRIRVNGQSIWTQEFNEFTPRDILITQGSYDYVRTQVSGTRRPAELEVASPSGLTGNIALLGECSENANRTYAALQAYCSTTTTASGAPKGYCDYAELQAINKVDIKCAKEAYNYCVYQAYRRENEIPSHVNQTTSSLAAGTTCTAILGTASAWDRVAVPSITIIWDSVVRNPIVLLLLIGLIIVFGTVFAARRS